MPKHRILKPYRPWDKDINQNDRARKWMEENPKRRAIARHKYHYKSTYGISIEEFEFKLKEQDNKCAICKNEISIGGATGAHIDHNHKTNFIRGILCNNCNRGLGLLGDNISRLFEAINYLRNSNQKEKVVA